MCISGLVLLIQALLAWCCDCASHLLIHFPFQISEYVRSGCEEATIEIELYQQDGRRNVIITRTFTLAGSSTWYIDYKTVKEKQVQELIASLNIQVSHLFS